MELKQILCVDDSEADQYLNKYRITAANPDIQIRQAFDGEQALELLREPGYTPDLILLDINMPRMNGFEFLEVYNAEFSPQTTSVVVMLTSSLLEDDRIRAEQYATVQGFLFKPLSSNWLAEIHEALDAIK